MKYVSRPPERQTACPLSPTFDLMSRRWSLHILKLLRDHGTLRYTEIAVNLPNVSHKTLTQRLKEMDEEGLLERRFFSEIPPRVEYSLSDKGMDLSLSVDVIEEWVKRWHPDRFPVARVHATRARRA